MKWPHDRSEGMSRDREIRRLSDAAIKIAGLGDRKARHQAGFWLDNELTAVDREYQILDSPFTPDAVKTDFMAVVKILLDFILFDCLEDDDWATTMKAEADLDQVIQEALRG